MIKSIINVMKSAACFAVAFTTFTASTSFAQWSRVVWVQNGGEFTNPNSWKGIDDFGGPRLPGFRPDTGASNAIIQGGYDNARHFAAPFTPDYRFDILINRFGPTLYIGNDLNLTTSNNGPITGIDILNGQINGDGRIYQTAGTVNTRYLFNEGVYELSGGALNAQRNLVTSDGGSFTLVGDSAVASSLNMSVSTSSRGAGKLGFVLGHHGVNPILLSSTFSVFGCAELSIDGSAYCGVAGPVTLVDAAGMNGRFNTDTDAGVGRYVRIFNPDRGDGKHYLHLQEVEVYVDGVNVALNKSATQSSQYGGVNDWGPQNAVDGLISNSRGDMTHTWKDTPGGEWWEVDLGADYPIEEIKIYNRDNCCWTRLQNYTVSIRDSRGHTCWSQGGNPTPARYAVASVTPSSSAVTVVGMGDQGTGWDLIQGDNGDLVLDVLVSPNAPAADAGGGEASQITSSCGGHPGEPAHGHVTLDGSGSTDPQNDIVSYDWYYDGDLIASGINPTVEFAHVGPNTTTDYDVQLVVTDAIGCQATDNVTVTIYDNEAADLVIFGGRTLQCGVDRAGEKSLVTPYNRGTDFTFATDACDGASGVTLTRTNPDGSTATATYYPDGSVVGDHAGVQAYLGRDLGETTWDYSTTDLSGNTITAQGKTTIVDTLRPNITAPANRQIECPWDNADLSPAAQGTATAVDGAEPGRPPCDPNVEVTYIDGPVQTDGCGLEYFERVWTATDNAGNRRSRVQRIGEVDTVPPMLVGVPPHLGDGTEEGVVPYVYECDAVPAPADVTAMDHCDDANGLTVDVDFTEETTLGSCAGAYSIERTWIATDCSGNATIAKQFIEVVDTTGPSLSVPADAQVECTGDTSPAATGSATGSDNCSSGVTITSSDSSVAGCGNTETITRTWTATDDCGNSTSGDQIITVADTTAPSITAPGDAVVECTGDTSPAATGSATGSDTCGSVTITSSDSSAAGCGGTETITRTWTATDECGNSADAVQTITVVDATAPSITAPADATVECTGDTSVTALGSATGSDDCGSVTISSTDSSAAGCGNTETITRTWTATDECGNSSSVDQVITTVDTTAPSISVPADATVECTGDTSPAGTGSASGSDSCGSVTVTSSDSSVAGCGNTETITRTWTVTDECGNATSGDQVITVVDTTAPVLTALTDTTIANCGDAFDASAGASATDTCGDATVSVASDVDTGNVGTYSVTYGATDECGNAAASVSRTVMVPYNLEGLLAPLSDQDITLLVSSAAAGTSLNLDCSGLKNIKAKRGGLPLKIRLTDCSGATVTDALLGGAEPVVTRILTLSGTSANPEIVDVVIPEDTGNSNPDGVMRISDDKWIYTLDIDDTGVDGLSAGCYAAEFEINLPGGGTVYAYAAFKLK